MSVSNALWRSLAWPGKEHLYLTEVEGGWLADGLVLASMAQAPFRFHYRVELDRDWTFQHLWTHRPFLDFTGEGDPECELTRDTAGNWSTRGFDDVPDLSGCIDIDISLTPFTNTLPIRRLALDVGAAAEIDVAYLRAPEMQLSRGRQRYTRLETTDGYDQYRFENLDSDFSADILVDRDGLVVDYPDLFTRL